MENIAKNAAGEKAAQLIESDMIVGLGSGSTAHCFINHLIHRCKEGLSIQAVSSSLQSMELAQKGGIQVMDINDVQEIDITVDGADEIDMQKRMIKGGGGAHVREKILASSSKEMVVIVDESKMVDQLGSRKLPVEVMFFGRFFTRKQIESLGFIGSWREKADGTIYVTENGNLLFDISFSSPLDNPESVHNKIMQIPGVIDTGLFFHLAGRVVVGYEDGSAKLLP